MAFSDLRAQSLDLFKNLSNMRSERKARASQNFIEGARRGLDKVYDSREKDKQRDFTAGESELERDARIAEIDRRGEVQSDLYEDQWEQPRLSYEDQEFFDPKTGKNYTWNTDQEYDLVREQIRSDRAAEQARLEAALRGYGDDDAGQMIREAYEFAKQELLWDPATQSFRDLSDMSEEELNDLFMDAILTGGFESIDPEAADRAYRLFQDFMGRFASPEEMVEEEPDDGRDGVGIFNWTPSGPATESFREDRTGILGRATAPFVSLLEKLAPATAQEMLLPEEERTIPEGVNNREADLWNDIINLMPQISDEDAMDTLEGYMNELQQSGNTNNTRKGQMQETIDYFLNQALGGR